jgi:hypothetical protein
MSKSKEPFLATMTRLSQLQKSQYLDPNGRKGSEHAPSKAATHGNTNQLVQSDRTDGTTCKKTDKSTAETPCRHFTK